MKRNLDTWEVRAGKFVRHYATEYHAEQMARALRLNGMDVAIRLISLRNDALTRLVRI